MIAEITNNLCKRKILTICFDLRAYYLFATLHFDSQNIVFSLIVDLEELQSQKKKKTKSN